MRYLLDTHIFLWWVTKSDKLSGSVFGAIRNPSNAIYISVASAWEIGIKNKSGKLRLKTSLEEIFTEPDVEVLPINLKHVFSLNALPLHHKDPFDRILIAQALVEQLSVITVDPVFKNYNIAIFP